VRDEVASVAPSKAAQLIARDGRPVLVLASVDGRALVTPRALAADAAAGRGALRAPRRPLRRPGTAACTPAAAWVRAHGVDVSAAAGQPVRGFVLRLPGRGRTPTPRDSRNVVAVTGGSAATSPASFGSPSAWTARPTAAAFSASPSATTTR
jgi:hypothetical protein